MDDDLKDFNQNGKDFQSIKCDHIWIKLNAEYEWCTECGVLCEADYMFGDIPDYYHIPNKIVNEKKS